MSEELLALRRTVDYIVDLHTNVRGLHRESDDRMPLRSAAGVLRGALEVARQELPPHTRVDVTCEPTATVYCDPTDLNRILVNLFINAGHAMAEAGVADPTLSVVARVEGGRIRIRVEDNGPGVLPELHESIFEPRFTTRTSRGGTGLGLAISRELATQNAGTLELEPPAAGGARFVVELAAGPDSTAPDGSPSQASPANGSWPVEPAVGTPRALVGRKPHGGGLDRERVVLDGVRALAGRGTRSGRAPGSVRRASDLAR